MSSLNMKKYLMKGMAVLAFGLVVVSCSDSDSYTAADARRHAEGVLGVTIDPAQNWKMTEEITANVSVNGVKSGETFTVAVYSNNPIEDGKGVYMTKGTVKDGGVFTTKVTCPLGKKSLYVGLTDSRNYTRYKLAKIVDGQLDVAYGVSSSSNAPRRTITIGNDTYDEFNFPTEAELDEVFPKNVPGDADEVTELESKYIGQEYPTEWGPKVATDIYAVYQNFIKKGHNLKVTTAGEVTIGGNYQNIIEGEVQYYNVYIFVDGDVIIHRFGAAHYNLYILKGNVTLPENYGQQAGIISVAAGATLNDGRKEIAANDGVKLFNRGTVYATNTEKYDIGNKSTVFNEGTFNVTGPLTYSPGAGNTSYFINYSDDAVLNAPSMTMNSTCHFYTGGTVNINGATSVTQAAITWINNGHYTTGSLYFSAHNSTFYNYCQLIVNDETRFLDGVFNMMQGSYAEMGRGLFDNFIVNMCNDSGINITGGTKWGRQGDGTYQGFRAVDDNDVCYVRLGGTACIPTHNNGAFSVKGKNLTLACESMKFYDGCVDFNQWTTYDGASYWNEVTGEALETAESYGRTWNLNDATLQDIADGTFSALKAGQCSATWLEEGKEKEEESHVYSYAFEDSRDADYDMNDVVLKVQENESNPDFLDITLCCTGASYNLTVYLTGYERALFEGTEVHQVLGGTQGKFINTAGANVTESEYSKFEKRNAQVTKISIRKPDGFSFDTADFWILSPEGEIHIATEGEDPHAVLIPEDWQWPTEWTCIKDAYPDFIEFAKDATHQTNKEWYKHPVAGLVYDPAADPTPASGGGK